MSETAFTPEAISALEGPLDPRRVSVGQSGPLNGIPYLEGHDVIRRANEIFGFGGWGFELVGQPVMVESAEQGNNKTPYQVWMATGRLMVTGGEVFADVGTCVRQGAGSGGLEMAIKGAVTDALKRCLYHYGDQFGLVLYDKETNGASLRAEYQAAHGQPQPQQQRRDVDIETGEIPASSPQAHQPAPQPTGTVTNWKLLTDYMQASKLRRADVEPVMGGFTPAVLDAYMAQHGINDPIVIIDGIVNSSRRQADMAGAR